MYPARQFEYNLEKPNIMKVSDFLSNNIANDDLNRVLDQNWVFSIVEAQIKYYEKYQNFHYPDVFILCYCNGKLNLLDGQHRRESLRKIYNLEKYKHIGEYLLSIRVIEAVDQNQKCEIFKMSNIKLVDNSSFYMTNDSTDDENFDQEGDSLIKDEIEFKKKCEKIKEMLTLKFGNNIFAPKLNTKNLVPKISLDDFITNLRLIPNIKKLSAEEIFKKLDEENNHCANYIKESNNNDMIKRKMKVESLNNNFYLSYYHFYKENKFGIKRTKFTGCKWLSLIFE